jgi:hypothetical protein
MYGVLEKSHTIIVPSRYTAQSRRDGVSKLHTTNRKQKSHRADEPLGYFVFTSINGPSPDLATFQVSFYN